MITIQGKSVFGGVSIGKLMFYKRNEKVIKREHISDADAEWKRFEAAKGQAVDQLKELYEKALEDVGEANAMIFEIHQMMLEDLDYLESIENIIRSQEVNAEYAVATTADNFAQMFASMDDAYMQGRAADVKDVSERVLDILCGVSAGVKEMTEPCIIAADDLAPSETVQLDKSKVLGFATMYGSANSHTAILARTMNIPAVIGLGETLSSQYDGKMAVIDGFTGILYVDPDEETLARMQEKRAKDLEQKELLNQLKGKENVTRSGQKINVYANIGNVSDLGAVLKNDAGGIGLLDEACACCNLAHPVISEYLGMQKELDALKQEEAEMENADVNEPIDYERVAERKTRIAKLEADLPAKQAAASEIQVTMDDVAKVIELWTGIPAVKIRETEFAKLANLEGELKKKIIGQDEAVHLVAQAIKRSRADLSGRRRPASFIFVGPTGVGKTELVKQLANQLFDGPDPLIRLDMSEYMEKYAVSRMIGSPPGYVGYEEAGQLTEKVRRRPYSVVLFDEIEKAHPDVMNILLQILDEGKINDAQGRTVDFSNTVICMTSNAGSSDQSTGGLGFNKSEEQLSEEKTRKALAQFLRPEFLGRVDEVIAFKPLTEETLQGIAALMLDEYKPGMEAKGIAYSYTPAALKALVQKSQGGKFGARDLRRVIRKAVEDPAAERLIDGSLASGGTLVVDADENGEVVLK